MARMTSISRLLWASIVTTGAASTACGRIGFDEAAISLEGPVANLPTGLTFDVECGAPAPVAALRIGNDGTEDLRIESATASEGFSVTSTLPIVIAPGATATLSVRAPSAVLGTDRDGSRRIGQLELTTNELAAPGSTIELVANVIGASLAITQLTGDPIVGFLLSAGSGACPPPADARLVNTGRLPVGVSVAASSGFSVFGFASGMLGVGEEATFSVAVDTAGPCSGASVVTFTATAEACASMPKVLQATFEITGAANCSCS